MLRRLLKQIYYSAAYVSGAAGSQIGRLSSGQFAPVLNLHRISPDRSDYWPPLTPALFEELLQFLTSRFDLKRITELGDGTAGKPVAALSFDDGYYDFIEYALPLLEKYRAPANMNVIPNCAISGKPIWNVQLYDFLHASTRADVNRIDIPGFLHKLHSDSPAAKVRFGVKLSHHLKSRPRNDRQKIWESIEHQITEYSGPTTRMMTTDEIRQIGEKVELGAHSFSHESMAFEDASFFEDDVKKCCSYFENDLGRDLSIYAFPNGSYRAEQIDRLRSLGVRRILLVDEKLADAKSDVLTRITLYGESGPELKMRSLGL